MMKKYIAPELEVMSISASDIVTLSAIAEILDFTPDESYTNKALKWTNNIYSEE